MESKSYELIYELNDVAQLTPEIMFYWMKRIKYKNEEEISLIVDDYFSNNDHGFTHSIAVWNRCCRILDRNSLIKRMAIEYAFKNYRHVKISLMIASIFHDIGRFMGAGCPTHEAESYRLVDAIFYGSDFDRRFALDAIIHHDYFNKLVDNCIMPVELMNPISEIFRLADKTSISASDELRRYYETGRRLSPELPVFDPAIPDDIRFDLANNINERKDYLTWMLCIFALQSTDFIYGDTRDAYALWARGKRYALQTIASLCRKEEYVEGRIPIDADEAVSTVFRFCKKNNLILCC